MDLMVSPGWETNNWWPNLDISLQVSWYMVNNASSSGDCYTIFIMFIGIFLCHLQCFINGWSPYSLLNVMASNHTTKLIKPVLAPAILYTLDPSI